MVLLQRRRGVIVEYADKEGGTYVRDYFQSSNYDYTSGVNYVPSANTGLATGIKAYFTNNGTEVREGKTFSNTYGYTEANGITDGVYTFDLVTEGDASGNYTFAGWYMLINGEYSFVTSEAEFKSEATNNDVYVARYYRTPSGTLNITHNLTSDSKGEATCYTKVELMNGATDTVLNLIKDYTTGSVTVIPQYMKNNSNNTLRITLKTSLVGITGFDSFKENITGTLNALSATGVLATVGSTTTSGNDVTVVIRTVAIKDFFTSGEQTVTKLPFFSKTTLPTLKYEITYNYKSRKQIVDGALSNKDADRLWGNQFYKAKGTFNDVEIKTYIDLDGPVFKSARTVEFLEMNTPFEKNFKEDIVWSYSGVSFNNPTPVGGEYTFTASMNAVQTTNDDINVTLKFPFDYTLNCTALDKTDNTVYTFTPTTTGGKVIYEDETMDKPVAMKFLDWFSLNKIHNTADMTANSGMEPELIEAPAVVYNGKSGDAERKRTFKWWELKTQGTNGSDGYVYKKVYSTVLNVPFYQDTVLVPVYSDEVTVDTAQLPVVKPTSDDNSATITWLQNSRTQWNYNGGGSAGSTYTVNGTTYAKYGDRLFSDFVLTYEYNNIKLNSVNPANYEVGILFEKLTESHEVAVPTLMETYKNNKGMDAAITELKKNEVTGNYTKSKFDVTKLDDKNSIEYYYSFANKSQSAANTQNDTTTFTVRRDNAYRAYSYIKVGSTIIVSDPVYFTYDDVAFIANGTDAAISGGIVTP